MQYQDIEFQAKDGVATVTINRPEKRNAVRPLTYEELTHAMHRASDDPEIGVVVLTGAGDKAFCAGGDISDQASRTPDVGRAHMRRLFALSSVMRMMDKPILAKIRGYCVGSGNEIHLFCDMSFAAEGALFGQTGPRVGSIPVWGACQLLARYVGERKAREMVFGCRQYTAQQALDMGLGNFVAKDQDLDALVDEWCQEILDKSPRDDIGQKALALFIVAVGVQPCGRRFVRDERHGDDRRNLLHHDSVIEHRDARPSRAFGQPRRSQPELGERAQPADKDVLGHGAVRIMLVQQRLDLTLDQPPHIVAHQLLVSGQSEIHGSSAPSAIACC